MISLFNYDILTIPDVFSVPGSVIMGCAIALFPLFLVSSVLEQNVRITCGQETNYNRIIKNTVLIFAGLVLYNHIFLKIIAMCEILALSVADNKQIYDAINFIATQSYSYVDSALGGGSAGHAIAALTTLVNLLSPKLLIMGFLTVLFQIAEPVLLFLRYALLSFLYIFGPIAFVTAVFEHTRGLLKGWFTNLFQIAFWIVTLRILELIIVQLQVQEYVKTGNVQDILPWMIINFVFIVFIIATPIITAKILSGDNLGTVASMIVGAVAITFGHASVIHTALKDGIVGDKIKATGAAIAGSHSGRLIGFAAKGAGAMIKRGYGALRGPKAQKNANNNEEPRR